MEMITAYKLVRKLSDGSLAPLFIDKSTKFELNIWMKAKLVPTKGYKTRFGFHACAKPIAPHLSKKNRVWCKVKLKNVTEHQRPEKQGGLWYTAEYMFIEKELSMKDVIHE